MRLLSYIQSLCVLFFGAFQHLLLRLMPLNLLYIQNFRLLTGPSASPASPEHNLKPTNEPTQDQEPIESTTNDTPRERVNRPKLQSTVSQPSTLAKSHPIHHLPDEILSQIFLSCVQIEWEERQFQKIWPTPAWTIARVCRRWRRISHDTPRLWAFVQFHHPSSLLVNHHLILLAISIDRAKAAPLSLHVKIEDEPDMTDSHIHELQSLFPRTRAFSYRISPAGSRSGLSKRLGLFRALNTLELQGVEDFGDTFLNCQELRVVSIHFRSWMCWSTVQLPWSQLTSLATSVRCSSHGDWDGFHHFLGLLSRAIALEELQIMSRMDHHTPGSSLESARGTPPIAHLGQLRRLALAIDRHVQRAWLPTLLETLSLPNLQSLALNTLGGSLRPESASKLAAMLKMPARQIRTLSLGLGPSTDPVTLGDIFGSLPAVQTLSFRLSSGHSSGTPKVTLRHIASLLTPKGDRQVVFPQLTCLKLCDDGKLSQAARLGVYLIEMLKSRTSPRLELLRLAFDKEVQPMFNTAEQSDFVSRYQEHGMHLSLTSNLSPSSRDPELDWWTQLAL